MATRIAPFAAEDGFARTLLTGAIAAAVLPAFVIVTGPLLGARAAAAVYCVVVAAGYLVVLARGARRRSLFGLLGAAGVAGVAAVGWASLSPPSPAIVATLATIGISFVRSGWLYRARPVRALLVESTLAVGSLGVASFLFASGLASAAFALWGWFVVQSFFFLIAGREPRRAKLRGDPFDVARTRLRALLDA